MTLKNDTTNEPNKASNKQLKELHNKLDRLLSDYPKLFSKIQFVLALIDNEVFCEATQKLVKMCYADEDFIGGTKDTVELCQTTIASSIFIENLDRFVENEILSDMLDLAERTDKLHVELYKGLTE